MDTETLWDELYRDGEVFPASVQRTPEILEALADGPADPDLLYLLAAMSHGTPTAISDRIRAEAAKAAATFRRLLDDDDPDVRAGAVSALVATDTAEADTIARLASDPEPIVRVTVALAFGILSARVAVVERLLEDLDPSVRYAAALALQKLARIDQRVVQTLVGGALGDESEIATSRAPWDGLYPWPDEAATQLELPMLEPALPILFDAVADGDSLAAEILLEVVFGARGAKAKPPTRLSKIQRDALEQLAASPDVWKARAQISAALKDYALPTNRRDLQRLLKDR